MNDLESRIRAEFHGREGDAPAFDLADARPVAGRTRRRQILNAAGAGVGALAIVVALTTGLGGLLRADRVPTDQRPPTPAGTAGIALPIEYPVGEQLPDLGDAPGPLAAIWVVPSATGAEPDVVGLVAGTGTFGTLPIDVSKAYMAHDAYLALSPDGRMIAYDTPRDELVVRDLVSGVKYSLAFEFKIRSRAPFDELPWYTWVDATHLVGHHAEGTGSEADGWVWQPGTAPKMVDLMTYVGSPYLGPHAGVYENPWFLTLPEEGDPRECLSLRDGETPVLCDVVGAIGPEVALTHDGDGAVVALDIRGVEDPALRHVVATAGAPLRVTFATDLIAEALDAPPRSPSQAQGFSTFSSALHEVTIGYPTGWKVRPATEPWRFGRLTFDASDVDVIFDPTRGEDLYLALASKPLGSLSREEWLDDSWRPGVCAKTAGAGSGGIYFGGARRYWTVSCSGGGGSSASGHYLRVATDTRGYLIYLHVANLRSSVEPPYDVDFFNSLLETLELEYTDPNGGSS